MKTLLVTILLIFSVMLNISLIDGYNKLESKVTQYDQESKFIWNDDEESIPTDKSLISLEFTKNGAIYIGPYNENYKTD